MAGLWESIATADANHTMFLSGGTPITAGEIRAAIDLNIDLIADKQGPVFLHTRSAAMFVVGLMVCARSARDVVCPAHAGVDYLAEIGVGNGVFLTDASAGVPGELRMRMPKTAQPASSATLGARPDEHLRLTFFTSGSTGTPKAVEKTLSQLEIEGPVLESLWGEAPGPVFGTVSHQHIYGMLFRVVWPITAGRPSGDLQADFWEQLADLLTPGSLLVTSPAHLTRLPDAPVLKRCRPQMIFSSGGPLPFAAAQDCNGALGRWPVEVLGSTETGTVAWRQRCSPDEPWTPVPGVGVSIDQDGCLAVRSAFIGDLEQISMGDLIEMVEGNRFRLMGRIDRVVKVEGRRVSLTRVEEALGDLEEVAEVAVVALPDRSGALGAVVVLSPTGAAHLTEKGAFRLSRQLRKALAGRLEPMERPKFWRFVPKLPVNSQGKRIAADFRALFEKSAKAEQTAPDVRRMDDRRAEIDIRLDADMIWFDGHFPDQPILPGVAQVHLAVSSAERVWNWRPSTDRLSRVKFRRVLRPGDRIRLILKRDVELDRLHFQYELGDIIAGEGVVGGSA